MINNNVNFGVRANAVSSMSLRANTGKTPISFGTNFGTNLEGILAENQPL